MTDAEIVRNIVQRFVGYDFFALDIVDQEIVQLLHDTGKLRLYENGLINFPRSDCDERHG